jgi:hypothetical protein
LDKRRASFVATDLLFLALMNVRETRWSLVNTFPPPGIIIVEEHQWTTTMKTMKSEEVGEEERGSV